MKKMMLLGALLVCAVAVSKAQESRQDFSASAYGNFNPTNHGLGVTQNTTGGLGFLGSYRFSVTPRSQLEVNYSYNQNSNKYRADTFQGPVYVHTRMQEISAAYVYSRTYKNFNPFLQLGGGIMIFTPIRDYGTSQLDTETNKNIGGLFGGGLAYEISPSFDVRVEYRGFLLKTPDFGKADYKTNSYEVISMPAIGIAYHF